MFVEVLSMYYTFSNFGRKKRMKTSQNQKKDLLVFQKTNLQTWDCRLSKSWWIFFVKKSHSAEKPKKWTLSIFARGSSMCEGFLKSEKSKLQFQNFNSAVSLVYWGPLFLTLGLHFPWSWVQPFEVAADCGTGQATQCFGRKILKNAILTTLFRNLFESMFQQKSWGFGDGVLYTPW